MPEDITPSGSDRFGGRFVVAVDGPAGSGKSSVSKAVAARFGFGYLDTGAAYRALAWHALQRATDPADPRSIGELIDSFDYSTSTDPVDFRAAVSDVDVTDAIRAPQVSARVGDYSTRPRVREFLNEDLFPALIAQDAHPGIVVEGRDITTVLAPDAPVRVLITASAEVRAARRGRELGSVGAEVSGSLQARDARDLTVVDFMNAAPGVVAIDTSEMSFAEVVDAVSAIVAARREA